MPLEIRELIIKATVNNATGNASGSGNKTEKAGEAKLNEIAEKVFEIIKQKAER